MKLSATPLKLFTVAVILCQTVHALPAPPAGILLFSPPVAAPRPAPPVVAPPPSPTSVDFSPDGFGLPQAGLTALQLADFMDGQDDFKHAETAATGLGPIYNNVSCAACHSSPSVGGASDLRVTRYGRSVNGVFDPLTAKGGTLLHEFTTIAALKEVIPASANVISERQTPPLYGLGLIEAIADATIIANVAAPKPPGVQGRVALVPDLVAGTLRVGRFGWKAQHATLLDFSADAYSNEMGITNLLFPDDNAPNGKTALLLKYDPAHPIEDEFDPVTNNSGIEKVTDYMRMLAAPPRGPSTPSSLRGERVFASVGCASCHTPSMTTGPSDLACLDHRPVPLYSDLLVHDMGRLGDGIAQADAGTREMRTAPLWGLRASGPYLHDGRAQTIDEAIRAHDGEAAGIQARYLRLSPNDRSDLLNFLRTL
jgi:CxxC motif-containing protein (DUF1111 family)